MNESTTVWPIPNLLSSRSIYIYVIRRTRNVWIISWASNLRCPASSPSFQDSSVLNTVIVVYPSQKSRYLDKNRHKCKYIAFFWRGSCLGRGSFLVLACLPPLSVSDVCIRCLKVCGKISIGSRLRRPKHPHTPTIYCTYFLFHHFFSRLLEQLTTLKACNSTRGPLITPSKARRLPSVNIPEVLKKRCKSRWSL